MATKRSKNSRRAPEKAGLVVIGAADVVVDTAKRTIDELADRGEKTVRRVRERTRPGLKAALSQARSARTTAKGAGKQARTAARKTGTAARKAGDAAKEGAEAVTDRRDEGVIS